MPGFDILDPTLNLKQNYFLEASAGTGKTYTIENCYVRLIQEGIPLDKILVVTFTRAATLELKSRIRLNLETKKMFPQLAALDEAKIFTIHGFCYQTLKENALESGFPLSQTEESASIESLKRIFRDFLRTQLTAEEIHPKQLEKVLATLQGDIDLLLKELNLPATQTVPSYRELVQEIVQEARALNLKKEDLLPSLLEAAPSFEKMCSKTGLKEEVIQGLIAFTTIFEGHTEQLVDLPIVKMVPGTLKAKRAYPEILTPFQERLIPLLTTLSSREAIVERMRGQFHLFLDHVCEKEDLFFFDGLLKGMQRCVADPAFAKKVGARYQAVLIDEFQDTDAIQWEIFSTLFLQKIPLYLVGDPKQSIYRFRGADLYTYMRAKEALGQSSYATLTKNYRSEPILVGALNTLFGRVPHLITLAKTGQTLPIQTIAPALPPSSKGGIFLCKSSDEEAFFAFVIQEIEKLHREKGLPLKKCALLVKDRYQAQRFCSKCPLPYVLKRSESLVDSEALPILEDVLAALDELPNRAYLLKVFSGPLFSIPLDGLNRYLEESGPLFYTLRQILEEKGILPFFLELEKLATFPTAELYVEMLQLIELLAETVSSYEEYLPFLRRIKQEDRESERLKVRMKTDKDAIQVMTIHVSKGLEFDHVFTAGLLASIDLRDEEERSEKMRQLYVAMTRAKENLYLPLIENGKNILNYFLSEVLRGETLENFVGNHEGFSILESPRAVFSYAKCPVEKEPLTSLPCLLNFTPSYLYSYSTLAQKKSYILGEEKKELSSGLPPGTETGILLHRIFEGLDFQSNEKDLAAFIENQIQMTHLEGFADEIKSLVLNTLSFPLPSPHGPFCLLELKRGKVKKELEFLYPSEEPLGYIKGFIDLFFEHNGWFYLLDWKSNLLENYTQESLSQIMESYQYDLQAELYARAAKHYLHLFGCAERFGGSFYLFLRGLNGQKKEGVYFIPNT